MLPDPIYVDDFETHVQLGRAEVSPKPKIQLADYIDDEQVLPALRRSVGHAIGLNDFKMDGNDKLGNCTCAAVEHFTHVVQWQDEHGADNAEDEQRPVDLYWATGTQDTGRNISQVLGYVRQHGYGGRKDAIVGYAGIDPTNIAHVSVAIDLLGGVDLGVALPKTAQGQRLWDVVGDPDTDPDSAPGSWGGHSVIVPGYNHLVSDNSHWTGHEPVLTWGMRLYLTQRFWTFYVDEVDAIISAEWLNKLGKSPRGLDLAGLESALKAIP